MIEGIFVLTSALLGAAAIGWIVGYHTGWMEGYWTEHPPALEPPVGEGRSEKGMTDEEIDDIMSQCWPDEAK